VAPVQRSCVVGPTAGVSEHQPGHPIRVFAQESERHVTTHRHSADDRLTDAFGVQQGVHVIGQQVQIRCGWWVGQLGARAETAQVGAEEPHPVGEPGADRIEEPGVEREGVQQNERRRHAGDFATAGRRLTRIIGHMSETIFTPGAEVLTTRGGGTVVDVRATPAGKFVIGVEDANGEVNYFTEKALRLAQS